MLSKRQIGTGTYNYRKLQISTKETDWDEPSKMSTEHIRQIYNSLLMGKASNDTQLYNSAQLHTLVKKLQLQLPLPNGTMWTPS